MARRTPEKALLLEWEMPPLEFVDVDACAVVAEPHSDRDPHIAMLDRVLAAERATGGMTTLESAYAANYAEDETDTGVVARGARLLRWLRHRLIA